MKIKKHGKKFDKPTANTEEFYCGYCGCEFECKDTEYYVHKGGGDWSTDTYTVSSITISATVKDMLVCSCPECHKIVKKVKQRQSYNCVPVTLTGCDSNSIDPKFGQTTATSASLTKDDSLNDILK